MAVRVVRQLLAIALGLLLWSLAPLPAFWALAAAYVVAIALLSALDATRIIERLPRASGAVLLVIALAAGVLALARRWDAFVEYEGLEGIAAQVRDRVRIEASPSIAPPLVVADRPQTFFVHATAGAEVRVRLGERAQALQAEELSPGLFRLDYDPKVDGAPLPADGPLRAHITCNGQETQRAMLAATPSAHPRWFALSPDRARAATVSEETDELLVVSDHEPPQRIAVGDGPTDAVFVNDRELAVAHRDDTAVWIVGIGDKKAPTPISRIPLGARQTRIALAPSGRMLAVARAGAAPEIVLIDYPSALIVAQLPLPSAPDWIAFGSDDATLLVATRADATLHAFKHRSATWSEEGALPLGRPVVTLARSNDGARVFAAVTDYRGDGSRHLGNHFVQDQILTIDTSPLRVVNALLTARRSPRQSKPGDVDRGVSPMGIAQARDGSLLVAFAGTDEVWRIRAGAPTPEMTDVGEQALYAPHGIAELANGTLVVSSPSTGNVGLFARDAARPQMLHLAPSDAELLAHDQTALARRLGERGFYEATRAGISCQSCHLHADSDEHAHNLGDHRLLPTLSVCGLAGTGPYLRDGSYPRLSDLDHVAQMLYRGYLRKTPGRPQTLEAYVAALPRRQLTRRVAVSPAALAQEQRGARVFTRAGCVGCHAPPAFTGLGQHLVASLFPDRALTLPADERLDAPSLLSVAASAPYLNDGRARTLRAVLSEHNRANRHGDTAVLGRADRDDLIAFLESL